MTTSITLKDASQKYLEHLKAIGKKASTIGTGKRTMDLLIAEMGEDKEVGKILPLHVDKFFKSEAATMQSGKDGLRPRAEASVLQIRRIVRGALVYWNEQDYVASVPLPKDEKKFLEPKAKKVKADKPKQAKKAKAKAEKPAPIKKPVASADRAPADKGETVAKMHFGGNEE